MYKINDISRFFDTFGGKLTSKDKRAALSIRFIGTEQGGFY